MFFSRIPLLDCIVKGMYLFVGGFLFLSVMHNMLSCVLGSFSISTGMITAHQLYNYITDHAGTYGMKPLRMSKAAVTTDNKKGAPSADLHEYALVALWNRYCNGSLLVWAGDVIISILMMLFSWSSGSFKDLEGLRHHDDFDVSLLVCHNAVPFEEQSEGERHLLRYKHEEHRDFVKHIMGIS